MWITFKKSYPHILFIKTIVLFFNFKAITSLKLKTTSPVITPNPLSIVEIVAPLKFFSITSGIGFSFELGINAFCGLESSLSSELGADNSFKLDDDVSFKVISFSSSE